MRNTWSMRTHLYLTRLSRPAITAMGFVATTVIGILDFITPQELNLSLFYLVPLFVVTWYAGKRSGIANAVFISLIWLLVELNWGLVFPDNFIPYWNALMRLAIFLVIVSLLSIVKHQQEGLEREVENKTAHLTREIRERELAVTALRKSEEKFSKSFMYVPSLLFISSTQKGGRFVEINEAFERSIRRERKEIIGRPIDELDFWVSPVDRDRVIDRLHQSGEVRDLEIAFRDGEGRIFLGLFSATIIEIEGEECLIGVVNDITERKQMEEEIRSLNADLAAHAAELEAANRELDTFNYSVAHDLRKPLTVINGYCQAIDELCRDKLDERCREYLQQAYEGTLQMDKLIGALLNFSRLIHLEPQRETVDLSALARDVATELRISEPGRRVNFRIAEGMEVYGDATLLRAVLDNLLGNAWKYTSRKEEGIIELGVTEAGGNRVFFVRDNGEGFDMADAGNFFAPFQRLAGAAKFKGFGIGLATVERIIRRHGGRIWAEGELGKGAAFYFTLEKEGTQR